MGLIDLLNLQPTSYQVDPLAQRMAGDVQRQQDRQRQELLQRQLRMGNQEFALKQQQGQLDYQQALRNYQQQPGLQQLHTATTFGGPQAGLETARSLGMVANNFRSDIEEKWQDYAKARGIPLTQRTEAEARSDLAPGLRGEVESALTHFRKTSPDTETFWANVNRYRNTEAGALAAQLGMLPEDTTLNVHRAQTEAGDRAHAATTRASQINAMLDYLANQARVQQQAAAAAAAARQKEREHQLAVGQAVGSVGGLPTVGMMNAQTNRSTAQGMFGNQPTPSMMNAQTNQADLARRQAADLAVALARSGQAMVPGRGVVGSTVDAQRLQQQQKQFEQAAPYRDFGAKQTEAGGQVKVFNDELSNLRKALGGGVEITDAALTLKAKAGDVNAKKALDTIRVLQGKRQDLRTRYGLDVSGATMAESNRSAAAAEAKGRHDRDLTAQVLRRMSGQNPITANEAMAQLRGLGLPIPPDLQLKALDEAGYRSWMPGNWGVSTSAADYNRKRAELLKKIIPRDQTPTAPTGVRG